jgi:hypothetical protein
LVLTAQIDDKAVQLRSEIFWNCDQKSARAAKLLGMRTKAVFGSAASQEILELRTKALHFVQPHSEKILN